MRRIALALFPIVLFACRSEGTTKFIPDRDEDGFNEEEDCDDNDPGIGEAETYYYDGDLDGHGDAGSGDGFCDRPEGYSELGDDCDDTNPTVYPGAEDICDDLDNDCDGTVDNGLESTAFYTDLDGDGYGDDASAVYDCTQPEGTVALGGDCDDGDTAYNPGALEEDCEDPNDYNCDGSVGYDDNDADGFAACAECDDANAAVNPDANEVCNGADDDCDALIDDADDSLDPSSASTMYADLDGDGYGDPGSPALMCEAGAGYVEDASDCDDSRSDINPGALEVCNGLDDDCDTLVDDADDSLDGATTTTWYTDADGDGYGDTATTTTACEAPVGGVALDGDCDDADAAYNPGASEGDCADPNDYNCDGSVGYADADGDGYAACEECDDADAAIFPSATELCDGADNDCDGTVDEADASDASSWYADADGDTYGDAAIGTVACDAPLGYVADATDCDDAAASVNPAEIELCNGLDDNCDGAVDEDTSADAASWYADGDGDGFGDAGDTLASCSAPSGYVSDASDCDDADAAVNPGAVEYCNSVDDDCDGDIDEDSALDAATWYADADGDSYGDAGSTAIDCTQPTGYVSDETDCDDAESAVNPSATEACNGYDDDCDGAVDEAGSSGGTTWYADSDGDGYGDTSATAADCFAPAGYVGNNDDCDDTMAAVNPAATEACNGYDDDCDGSTDEAGSTGSTTWYADSDGDGYGDAASTDSACTVPSGYVGNDDDCDDTRSSVSPAGTETCNGRDDDCDGATDEAGSTGSTTYYADDDADGYGDAGATTAACSVPSGYVSDSTDCDDADPDVNPAATEVCNGYDDDCDGSDDEGVTTTYYADADSDGYGNASSTVADCSAPSGYVANSTDCDDGDGAVHPLATEVCNGYDDDCDSVIDEGVTTTYYADTDGDGYGNASSTTADCSAPSGYVSNDDDCNDALGAVHPGATEACNGYDDDCDGSTDEAGSTGSTTYYADTDGDGYGDSSVTTSSCSAPAGYVATSTDCDDGDIDINPGESDVCDTVDNDCDGSKDNDGLCPCDVEEYGGHAYMFCEVPVAWTTGETSCLTYGYDYTTVNDVSENTWIIDQSYPRFPGKWWIGLNDRSSEGTFVWANGETATYRNWHSGEPNDSGGNEDCTQLGRWLDDTWNDEPCTSSFRFICEE